MTVPTAVDVRFDGPAMIRALDEQRRERGLDFNDLAIELHAQSSELNALLQDNCMCSGALVRTVRRGTMSCQYALPLLRWIGRAPEDFLTGDVVDVGETRLPAAGPDQRLRWDLPSLGAALDARRQELGLTWAALGRDFGCSSSRLSNLRTARLADMDLAMQVAQYLGRPAADFIGPTDW